MLSVYAQEDAPGYVAAKTDSVIPDSLLSSGPAVIPIVVEAGVKDLEEFGLYNIMFMSLGLPATEQAVYELIDEVRRTKSHVPDQVMRLANRLGNEGVEALVKDLFSSPKHSALGALALLSSPGLAPSAVRLLTDKVEDLLLRQLTDRDSHRLAELALLVLASSGQAAATRSLESAASKNSLSPDQYRQQWITEAWLFLTDAREHMPKE